MDPKKPLIVVIDDSRPICKIFEAILRREGYQVQTFLDPVVTLREIFGKDEIYMPHIWFVDLVLPSMDGFEVISYIKKYSLGEHIPIIAMSRRDNPVDRLKLRLLKADAYLVKPFKTQDIIDLVKRYTTVQEEGGH